MLVVWQQGRVDDESVHPGRCLEMSHGDFSFEQQATVLLVGCQVDFNESKNSCEHKVDSRLSKAFQEQKNPRSIMVCVIHNR